MNKKDDNIKLDRENIFREYFELITKIVYTLNLISDRNNIATKLSRNINKSLGYDDGELLGSSSDKSNNSNSELESLKTLFNADLKALSKYKKYNFNIDKFIREYNLNLDERLILYCVLTYSVYGDVVSDIYLRRILEFISVDNGVYFNKYEYLDRDSKLVSLGILSLSQDAYEEIGMLEMTRTLVCLSNSKITFAFLEKYDYEVIVEHIEKFKSIKESKNNIILRTKFQKQKILTPKQILSELNKLVIGQEDAKKVLSVHGYMHCLRMNGNKNIPFRSNIMMIGSTGVGKTYLVKSLASILELPFARADVTTLTETGYVGDDVEVVLYNLYKKANGDLDKAQFGIVFLDEVDKIAKADAHESTTGNPSDKAVQEALLSMMNGEDVRVPEFGDRRMMHSSDGIIMNTKNILFIFGGAFVGLEDIIKMRLKGENSLGFGSSANLNRLQKDKILRQVDVKDIEKYGMIPEFIGRIPIIITLNNLSKDNLKDILLKTSDSPILKYKTFFESIGKDFIVTDDALDFIVDRASSMNMGARSLKSIVETVMLNILFNMDGVSGKTFILNKLELENVFNDNVTTSTKSLDKSSSSTKKGDKNYMA